MVVVVDLDILELAVMEVLAAVVVEQSELLQEVLD